MTDLASYTCSSYSRSAESVTQKVDLLFDIIYWSHSLNSIKPKGLRVIIL